MELEQAVERLCNALDQRNDCPDDLSWLFNRHELLKVIARKCEDGLITVRGRPWKNGELKEAEKIPFYADIFWGLEGIDGDLLHAYQRPKRGRNRRGPPIAEWRELTISDDDFNRLWDYIFETNAEPIRASDRSENGTNGSATGNEARFVDWMKSEKLRTGRYPPRGKSKKSDHQRWSNWASNNGVPRDRAQAWVTKHKLSDGRGAPTRNLAKK